MSKGDRKSGRRKTGVARTGRSRAVFKAVVNSIACSKEVKQDEA